MKRHLLYYVHPRTGNGVWEWNCDQLLARRGLFDGRRVVAISTSTRPVTLPILGRGPYMLDPPGVVRERLASLDCEFIEVPADDTGEAAAFDDLRSALPRDGVTFYAHTKGVSYTPADERWPAVRQWAELLYSANLDFWPLIEASFLCGAHAVGSMRQTTPGDPHTRFIYSGAFFWFHIARAATRPRYNRKCIRDWAQVELWPGKVFRLYDSACLFKDYPSGLQAYDRKWMDATWREFVQWRQDNAEHYHPHGVLA